MADSMEGREIEGLLLVDKAKGSSSFQVVSKVRRALGTRSVGHVGTLDPLASGLLVFLIGRYTRLSNYLMAGAKAYHAVIELGVSTTTDDKEGEILESSSAEHLTEEQIRAGLLNFLGIQQQIPPAFSAISMNGVRAYRRARAGEIFEMSARKVEIHGLEVLGYQHPFVTVDVRCSKGTYIRSLARDLGAALGVPSHLADLRRLNCSGYDVEGAISEADLSDHEKVRAHLRSGLPAIKGLEVLGICSDDALRLRNGQRVVTTKKDQVPGTILLAALGNEPVALCRIENSQLMSVRGF